tara:strand:- start:1209 stop:1559 length:351 start_codon:yes stop_codon:yes gene_type:complete
VKEFIIYHNPRCSKSRQALQLLREAGIEPTIVEYLKTSLEKDVLKNISQLLGLRPKDFVRKIEKDFKDNDLSKSLEDDDKILEAMSLFPKIIERPIVVSGQEAVIGRPPENVQKLI